MKDDFFKDFIRTIGRRSAFYTVPWDWSPIAPSFCRLLSYRSTIGGALSLEIYRHLTHTNAAAAASMNHADVTVHPHYSVWLVAFLGACDLSLRSRQYFLSKYPRRWLSLNNRAKSFIVQGRNKCFVGDSAFHTSLRGAPLLVGDTAEEVASPSASQVQSLMTHY